MGVRWLLLVIMGFFVLGSFSSTNHDAEGKDPEISRRRNVRSALSEANDESNKKEHRQKVKNQDIKRKNILRQQANKNDKARRKYQVRKKTNRPKKNAQKAKGKRKQGFKNKSKIQRKKIKQTRRRKAQQKKIPTRQTQTCSGDSPVASTCMTNAKDALVFEATFVTNYLKQSKQLIRHSGQADNKMGKKGEFVHAAEHMLMAIGGNLSKPLCGRNSSSSGKRALDLHLENYDLLMNCSNAINESCTVDKEAYNETKLVEIKACNSSLEEFRTFTKTCMTNAMKNDATKQCTCWTDAKAKMDAIKKLKCSINKQKKKVTSDKRACVAAFGKCKKMEDESVKLIHTCMDDHSMKLINQTAASLHSGAMKDTGKALGEAEDTAKAVIAGEVNIGKQLDEDPYNDNK